MRPKFFVFLTPLLLCVASAASPLLAETTLRGRVTTSDAQPVADAEVILEPLVAPDPTQAATPAETVTGATDATGLFQINVPREAAWRLEVRPPTSAPFTLTLLHAVDSLDLPPLVLPPSASLDVRVTRTTGSPRAGVELIARPVSDSLEGPWAPAEQRASVDGPSGTRLKVAGPTELLAVTEGGIARRIVDPRRDPTVQLRLQPSRRIPVEVRDAADRPVPQVAARVEGPLPKSIPLRADPTDSEGRTWISSPLVTSAEDRRSGHPVRLVASDGRWATGEVSAEKLELDGVASGEPVTVFRLKPPIEVAGRVIDAVTRSPLSGAVVWWRDDPNHRTRTDGRGNFSLRIPFLDPDAQPVVGAAAGGYQPIEALRIGDLTGTTLALRAAATIHGQLVDARGRPVVGARLSAAHANRVDPPVEESIWAWSDERGGFQLRGLDPGQSYWLRIDGDGYLPTRITLAGLRPGLHASPLEIELQAGTSAVGRVIDVAERPIAGAVVHALPTGAVETNEGRLTVGENVEVARSDHQGHFYLPLLPAGPIDLYVSAEGFAPASVRGVELVARNGPADLGVLQLDEGATVRGRVIDARGEAIADATIDVLVDDIGLWGQVASAAPPPQVTAAAGSFLVPDRRAGEKLRLRVRHPDYVPRTLHTVAEIDGTEVLVVELELAARLAGRVIDQDGEGVPGAAVMVENHEGRLVAGAECDASGHFAVGGLGGDRFRLSVLAEGFLPATVAGLEPAAGETLDDVEVVLSTGAQLEGRVVDLGGEGVATARVTLADQGPGGRLAKQRVPETLTDGDGNYRLAGLRRGRHQLTVEHAEYVTTRKSVQLEMETTHLDVKLHRGASVAGRVLDATGRPVAGAEVHLLPHERSPSPVSTSFDGTFQFSAVDAGNYHLQAKKQGFPAVRRHLRVGTASLEDVELRLDEGSTVTGRILGLDLDELARVRVAASGPDKTGVTGRVDHDGRYRVTGLTPGDWIITASLDSRQTQSWVSLPSAGDEALLDLEFIPGLTLTGSVEHDGTPVPGALVALRAGAMGVGGAMADATGRFHVTGLEAGIYDVTVVDPRSGLTSQERIVLEDDLDVRFELRSPPPLPPTQQESRNDS